MPPANNNLASATVITGASGSTTGSNVGATGESGEPANNGKSVWFKFVSPSTGTFFFATIFNSGGNATDFPSILQVFTGASVSTLTEVGYLQNEAHGYGGGFDYGAYVTVACTSGTTYYVRVDGRAGAEGNILLSWGAPPEILMGGCTGCGLDLTMNDGAVCLGSATVSDPFNPAAYSFGTQPAGTYVVKYARGAMFFENSGNWTVCYAGTNFQINVSYSGGAASASFVNAPVAPAGAGYPNQHAAEVANRCAIAYLAHAGGDISVTFSDSPYYDNRAGSPCPTFCLYRFTPYFVANGTDINRSSSTNLSGSFKVQNLTQAAFNGVTVTLAATGGISSPSSPVVTNFPANSTTSIAFTFQSAAGNTNLIATLSFSDGVNTYSNLTFDLNPIIVVDSVSLLFAFGSNDLNFNFKNIGLGPTYALTCVVTSTNNFGTHFPATTNFGIKKGGVTFGNDVFVPTGNSGANPVTFTFTLHDGSATYPVYVFTTSAFV